MTTQIKTETTATPTLMSTLDNLFYVGLGVGAGIALALGVQAIWQVGAELLAAGDLLTTSAALVGREAQTMGLPLADGSKAFWYMARAGGIIAYLLLWLATLWGVLISSKMVKGWIDGTLLYRMHEFLPLLAMIFAVVHALVLLGDTYIGFGWLDLLIPFRAPYRAVYTGFGSLALYLSIALIASFYMRTLISRRTWRLLHYLTYLAFGLALVHGVMTGADTRQPAVYWMYIVTGATLLFATFYRVLASQGSQRTPARVATTS
jgi:predicted ferric reductase